MPPSGIITEANGNGYISATSDCTGFGGTTVIANNLVFTMQYSSCTSACTGMTTFANWHPNGFITTGMTCGGGAQPWGSGTPMWDPVQAAALRADFAALKSEWKRKRAEVKARRLFRRVVGDIAWENFKRRGYHEIYGASRTRYRLRPGFRVQVMKGCADEVDYELCAHLKIGIPWFDSMAVQSLMLSTSLETEEKFKSVANKHLAHGAYPIPELTEAA